MTATHDELFSCLEEFVMTLFSHAESDTADLLVEMDLSITQARTVFALGQADGPLPINEIATRLGLSVASAGRNIDAMHRVGMVERLESPDDRRVKLVSLTDKGRRIAEQHLDEKRRALREFADRVPETQAAALTQAFRPVLTSTSLKPSSHELPAQESA